MNTQEHIKQIRESGIIDGYERSLRESVENYKASVARTRAMIDNTFKLLGELRSANRTVPGHGCVNTDAKSDADRCIRKVILYLKEDLETVKEFIQIEEEQLAEIEKTRP